MKEVWGQAPIDSQQKRNELRTKGMQNINFLCNDNGIKTWKNNYEDYKIDLSEEIVGYPTFGHGSDPIRTGPLKSSPSLRENGIVYLPLAGIFANEPSPGQVPNVEYSWASQITDEMKEQTITGTDYQRNMQNLEFIKAPRMELVATQTIPKNQEILWCYGDDDSRNYEVADVCTNGPTNSNEPIDATMAKYMLLGLIFDIDGRLQFFQKSTTLLDKTPEVMARDYLIEQNLNKHKKIVTTKVYKMPQPPAPMMATSVGYSFV